MAGTHKMADLECFEGTMEEALDKVGYTSDIQVTNFSPYAKFSKNEMPGVTATYNTDVVSVFHALLSDSSTFVQQWRRSARGDKDFEETNWAGGTNFSGVKLFKCNTRVKEFISWNWVPFSERQRYVLFKPPDGNRTLLVNFSSQTPTVTLGENFRIEALLEFVESGGSTHLKVYSYIHFLANLGFIEGKVKSVGTSESIKSFRYFVELSPAAVKTHQKEGGKGKGRRDAKKKSSEAPPPMSPAALPAPMPQEEEPNQLMMPLIAVSGFLLLLVIYLLFVRSSEPEHLPGGLDPILLSALGIDKSQLDLEKLLMLNQLKVQAAHNVEQPTHLSGMYTRVQSTPPQETYIPRGTDVTALISLLSQYESKYTALKSSSDWYLSVLTVITFISLLVAVNGVRLQKQS
eukprot:TRINITY_DN5656_c0_g2_i1.p1 TRINITY_DN5656_c0_g2~~TRINITY_DN5656_c0_g2_i1.p1  ORF type:complete len:404 (+),score=110.70 TRINITY_DN5656_c0_g2_i1:151-1362(+)